MLGSRPCALCGGMSHINNECPAAGSKSSMVTTCGICQTYFNYAKKQQKSQSHLLSYHGFVRPDSCPVLAQVSQEDKANFLRKLNRCTACFSRAGHKFVECLSTLRFRKYICTHPSCYCHRSVCPSPEHNNSTQPEEHANKQGWSTRPNLISLACYLPAEGQPLKQSQRKSRSNKNKRQINDRAAKKNTESSKECKESEVETLKALVKEPARGAPKPHSHPPDTTSMQLLSAWTDIDLPVSIWSIKKSNNQTIK